MIVSECLSIAAGQGEMLAKLAQGLKQAATKKARNNGLFGARPNETQL
ncbi:MAG TPA: hypothetical protein PLP22_04505 [Candidatus Competibacter sp.]|nr:hypothetical protein [Candidatus Competibacter sp.]HUM94750.1 hypothetical protein [Candidatus Competibacter sp.]